MTGVGASHRLRWQATDLPFKPSDICSWFHRSCRITLTFSLDINPDDSGAFYSFCHDINIPMRKQGFGASSVLAVGAGSIGDIYKPTERGRAMGVFYGVGVSVTVIRLSRQHLNTLLQGALLGPAISPVIASIMTQQVQHYTFSPRVLKVMVCISPTIDMPIVVGGAGGHFSTC